MGKGNRLTYWLTAPGEVPCSPKTPPRKVTCGGNTRVAMEWWPWEALGAWEPWGHGEGTPGRDL